MRGPTSRWRGSTVTFGPVGRAAWTVVCLVIAVWPLWQAITVGWIWIALYVGGVPLLFVIFPLVMRDVWKKVPNPDYGRPLDLPPEPTPPAPGESLHDRQPPQRW
jgi:hypothetical protein